MNRLFIKLFKTQNFQTKLLHNITINNQNKLRPFLGRTYVQKSYFLKSETPKATEDNDTEFGVGGRYTELDKPRSEQQISYNKIRKFKVKNNDSDEFGTLGGESEELYVHISINSLSLLFIYTFNFLFLRDIEMSTGFKKPLSDIKHLNKIEETEQNEIEKRYDRVLNHIRLSNGKDRQHSEYYYVTKINELTEQRKVSQLV
jgi:hypothetical protein